jgi:hypothetical protein
MDGLIRAKRRGGAKGLPGKREKLNSFVTLELMLNGFTE